MPWGGWRGFRRPGEVVMDRLRRGRGDDVRLFDIVLVACFILFSIS